MIEGDRVHSGLTDLRVTDTGHVAKEPSSRAGGPNAMARPGIARWAPGVALLGSYERQWLRPDGLAALSVWALLIPQGLAYAQLAGMPPVTGLYVGMIAMLAYGLFGTSRYLNIGPESSVAILIASSLVGMAAIGSDEYVALASTLALLVGVML